MRGRKINQDFVTEYMIKKIETGTSSLNDIYNLCKLEICDIDEQIKKAEELKAYRCKLIDVKLFLEKNEKKQ